MIYGKVFSTMFEGSLVGAGSDVFAVMSYVICHMQPDAKLDKKEFVRLHPKILQAAIGETEERMRKAIEFLCQPDRHTMSPGEKGRRLVQVEQFVYRVVNGKYYRALKDEKDRLAKASERQAKWRERQKLKTKAGQDEVAQERLLDEAEQAELEKARAKEHKARLKLATKEGKKTGARQAINEGFESTEG